MEKKHDKSVGNNYCNSALSLFDFIYIARIISCDKCKSSIMAK